jgi:ectoine hydroxylase-related dioxygenase (phytanoyl-CoA dioxygenase family)
MWHLDYPVRGPQPARFGVKALCLLADLVPRGGGTLLLEGSHHLTTGIARTAPADDAGHARDVRRRLAREHPWLRDLFSTRDGSDRVRRFMRDGADVAGTHLRVVELAGEAGDVVFFHPWLFHNASPNCRRTPRLLLGQNLPTRAALAASARAPRRAPCGRPRPLLR